MKQYLDLLRKVLEEGEDRPDRTGVGTRSIFGPQLHFDLSEGFPLVTTKRVWFKGIVVELLWFLRGDTNIKFLQNHGVHIWDEWADKFGDLGPVYGELWRRWHEDGNGWVDQIAKLVEGLKTNPWGRRHIITAWDPKYLPFQRLPPCHVLSQYYVGVDGTLSCKLTMRSCDLFLGTPYNIACYSLLTSMLAKVCDLKPGKLIFSAGDAHIYKNHFDQVAEQLTREPRPLPILTLAEGHTTLDDWLLPDFDLFDYKPHPRIKAPIAV